MARLTLCAFVFLCVWTTQRADACTAISSLPATITSSGVYCLTADATFTPTGTYQSAIYVNVSDSNNTNQAVIDFGGYSLRCLGTYCSISYGVYVAGGTGAIVQNGRVVDFSESVYLYSGKQAVVRDLRLSYLSNGYFGGIYIAQTYSAPVIQRTTIQCSASYIQNGITSYYNDTFSIVDNTIVYCATPISIFSSTSPHGGQILSNRISQCAGQPPFSTGNTDINAAVGFQNNTAGPNCTTAYPTGSFWHNLGNNVIF